MITTLLIAILGLAVIVLIHETGHFLAARACGVAIETFSIGFGPEITSIEKNGIRYRFAWILLGGYVKMKGEYAPGENDKEPDPDDFEAKVWWQRALIALAGPAANFVLAIVLFSVAFIVGIDQSDFPPLVGNVDPALAAPLMPGDSIVAVNGQPVRGWNEILQQVNLEGDNRFEVFRDDQTVTLSLADPGEDYFSQKGLLEAPPVVGEIVPASPAYRAGLQEGDRIMRIGADTVRTWSDINRLVQKSGQPEIEILVKRSGEKFTVSLKPQQDPLDEEQRRIGIWAQVVNYSEAYPVGKSIVFGSLMSVEMVRLSYIGLYKLVSGTLPVRENMGSIVMVVPMTQSMTKRGMGAVLRMFAAISIVLMITNLLPVPVLDGGMIMFAVFEAFRGKPVPQLFRIRAQQVGFVLLIALMLFVVMNDFEKIVSRNVAINSHPAIEQTQP